MPDFPPLGFGSVVDSAAASIATTVESARVRAAGVTGAWVVASDTMMVMSIAIVMTGAMIMIVPVTRVIGVDQRVRMGP